MTNVNSESALIVSQVTAENTQKAASSAHNAVTATSSKADAQFLIAFTHSPNSDIRIPQRGFEDGI